MKKKVTVIAELCQNHKGDIKLVEEMVHAATEAGADIAKIQSIDSSDLTHRKKFDEFKKWKIRLLKDLTKVNTKFTFRFK